LDVKLKARVTAKQASGSNGGVAHFDYKVMTGKTSILC
jgi:hypothetical protein